MNKGLAVHIISTIIFCLMMQYIYFDGPPTNRLDRSNIVFFFCVSQLVTALICGANGFYDKYFKK